MRWMFGPFLALPLAVACTSDAQESAQNEVAAQSQAQNVEKSPVLETVYGEPANKPARARNNDALNEKDAQRARTARAQSDIARHIDYDDQGAPEGTDALAHKLRARHPEGIPTREDLRADPASPQKLLFIEEHAALMLEQQRALVLMRHVYTDDVRRRLLDRAQDRSRHVSVRSAALQSLAAAADARDSQAQEVLRAARQDENPRIQRAASGTAAEE